MVDDSPRTTVTAGGQQKAPEQDRLEPITTQPVFVVDNTFYRSRTPKTMHWSIAWSDLMMTMFILFLTLFVYQLAHRTFLTEERPEVLAGQVLHPQQLPPDRPFTPISPVLDAQTRPLRRLEAGRTPPIEVGSAASKPLPQAPAATAAARTPADKPLEQVQQEPGPLLTQDDLPLIRANMVPEPAAAKTLPEQKPAREVIRRIYDLSRYTLASEKLDRFAKVEMIPDKAMRIILTGDLLFESGQAKLSSQAKSSLRTLLPLIRQSPYMINVVGHTDSMPMASARYPTNWELSTARASRVARFLIEEGEIPPNQIMVAGYGSYRPVKPNTTEKNRQSNRRVEIILSRKPPPPLPPTAGNLKLTTTALPANQTAAKTLPSITN